MNGFYLLYRRLESLNTQQITRREKLLFDYLSLCLGDLAYPRAPRSPLDNSQFIGTKL